jgi:hypothetical protein
MARVLGGRWHDPEYADLSGALSGYQRYRTLDADYTIGEGGIVVAALPASYEGEPPHVIFEGEEDNDPLQPTRSVVKGDLFPYERWWRRVADGCGRGATTHTWWECAILSACGDARAFLHAHIGDLAHVVLAFDLRERESPQTNSVAIVEALARTGQVTLRLHHQEMAIRFATADLATWLAAARTIGGELDADGEWYRPGARGGEHVEALRGERRVIEVRSIID